MNTEQWILVADQEIQMRRLLKSRLEAEAYRVFEADNGQDALRKVVQHHPDLIILEWSLPELDGLTVLQQLRTWTQTPVIILGESDTDQAKITAFEAGADDYLVKPFSIGELRARLRVAHRRIQPVSARLTNGDLQIDLTRRWVTRQGNRVKLTPTEYAILRLLAQHVGEVVTHQQILYELWGLAHSKETHHIQVYIAQLRHKLEPTSVVPQVILTEFGVGYRLLAEHA